MLLTQKGLASFQVHSKSQHKETQTHIVCFLLSNSPASEFYMPTFRNTLSVPSDGRQSVPKRRHIKFRRRGITQKKTYNIQNTAKVRNQENSDASPKK